MNMTEEDDARLAELDSDKFGEQCNSTFRLLIEFIEDIMERDDPAMSYQELIVVKKAVNQAYSQFSSTWGQRDRYKRELDILREEVLSYRLGKAMISFAERYDKKVSDLTIGEIQNIILIQKGSL